MKKTQNGIYGDALHYMPYSQATVRTHSDGTVDLISYRTHVARVNPDGSIECYGLYSATTRRHIGAFAKEHGLTYYDFKNAYLNGGATK